MQFKTFKNTFSRYILWKHMFLPRSSYLHIENKKWWKKPLRCHDYADEHMNGKDLYEINVRVLKNMYQNTKKHWRRFYFLFHQSLGKHVIRYKYDRHELWNTGMWSYLIMQAQPIKEKSRCFSYICCCSWREMSLMLRDAFNNCIIFYL